MLHRLIIMIVGCGMLCSLSLFGQSMTSRAEPAFKAPKYRSDSRDVGRTIDVDSWTDQAAKDISQARPGAFTPNSSADRVVVRSVFNSMKSQRKDLNEEESLQAIFSAWVDLSIGGYDKQGKEVDYTEADLLRTALETNKIKIETKPDGATIIVNNYEKPDKTNAKLFLGSGEYTIVLKKTGYRDRTIEKVVISLSEIPKSISETLMPIK